MEMDNDLLTAWLRRPGARDLIEQIAAERGDAEARLDALAEDLGAEAGDAEEYGAAVRAERDQAREALRAAERDTAALRDEIQRLRVARYWYLASPYEAHPSGLQIAYESAVDAMATLLPAGVVAVSPIVLGHPVAIMGNINATDHATWLPLNTALMDAARGLIVLKAPGWSQSRGLRHELERMARLERPIIYMTPGIVPAEVFA